MARPNNPNLVNFLRFALHIHEQIHTFLLSPLPRFPIIITQCQYYVRI